MTTPSRRLTAIAGAIIASAITIGTAAQASATAMPPHHHPVTSAPGISYAPELTPPVLRLPLYSIAARIDDPSMIEFRSNSSRPGYTSGDAGKHPTTPPATHADAIASQQENSAALGDFANILDAAVSIGSIGGTIIGAGVGCVIGAAAGVGVLSLPGCLTVGVTGAGIGAVLGTIAVGGPALIGAGAMLLTVLSAPDGSTQYSTHQH